MESNDAPRILARSLARKLTSEEMEEDPVNLQDQRVMEFSLRRLTGGISMAVVAMVCGGCGFLRMHSVDKAIQSGCLS